MTLTTNTSGFADAATARTHPICAAQRAGNLAQRNTRSVLELCAGPSLKVLEAAYAHKGIECWGNDVDHRWEGYYPQGSWLLGDCFEVFLQHRHKFDAVVFAPPLSARCSGTREDSLSVLDVQPGYLEFLDLVRETKYRGTVVLTLPGRALSTRYDRSQFYRLLAHTFDFTQDVMPLTNGCRKYVDILLRME